MKTIRFIPVIALLVFALGGNQALAQQEGNGKGRGKGQNQEKEHPGKGHGRGHDKHKDQPDSETNPQGRGNGKGQSGKEHKPDKENRKSDRDGKNGKEIEKADKGQKPKDQVKEAGKQKITICHKPAGDSKSGVTLTISERAWKAHQAHGDTRGDCPTVQQPVQLAAPMLKKRDNFYEKVTGAEEKVYDAEDVLEMARERLRVARERLETGIKTGKLPQPELEKQKASITRTNTLIQELEQLVTQTRSQLKTDLDKVERQLTKTD